MTRVQKTDISKILATAGLLIVDALVFHEILSKKMKIETLAKIRASRNIKKALEDSWETILQKDYEPIFQISLEILKELPTSPQINDALLELINIAYDISCSPVLLRHDLFGRIYHQLLLGKLTRYYATYYTSIPAARLLSRILIGLHNDIEFTLPPKIRDRTLHVVDFACGSGTLLSAVYKEIDIKHRCEEDPDPRSLHKHLIEEILWGFDVLQHATHLASTTLFLHEPFQPVDKSNIYSLRLGQFGSKLCLGSIDFLESSKLLQEMLLSGELTGPEKISIEGKKSSSISLPMFDICIMNPPFTRSVGGNLLFGGLPKTERKALQEELKRVLKKHNIAGVGKAGLGAVFFFLADKYLFDGGRIGLVLPKGVLQGIAWKKVREKLLKDYHVEYVISSFEAPGNWNFSENSALAEILIVARKQSNENINPNLHTIFVNLWQRPINEIEAIAIGSQLLEMYEGSRLFDICSSNCTSLTVSIRGRKRGEAYSAVLEGTEWGHYTVFAQTELNRVLNLLRKGILYVPRYGIVGKIPMAPLSNFITDIGPDRRQIHTLFSEDPSGIYPAFWGISTDNIRSILQKPNSALAPKVGKASKANTLWKDGCSDFLIIEKFLPCIFRTLSLITSGKVLSNMFWTIRTTENDLAKILAMWLNSTFGMMLLFSIGELEGAWIAGGPWFNIKKGNLNGLPVLDINRLKDEERRKLIDFFDEISSQEFQTIPDELKSDGLRKKIDRRFLMSFGLDLDLSVLYDLLAKDSTITSKQMEF